jgi:hypothetical protein
MAKVKNSVILSVIYHRENPLEFKRSVFLDKRHTVSQPTFKRNIPYPSSPSKNRPSKNPA